MDIIRVENNYSWFLSDNKQVKEALWESLRFPSKGYFHSIAYKMKRWDGYINFFNKDSGKFLTGLLPEIEKALTKYFRVPYKIEDKRNHFDFITDRIDENLFNSIALRDYQVDYINQVIKHRRGIIPSPTGSGKSLTFAGIVSILPPKTPTLVLMPSIDLVEQNYDELIKRGVKNVGRFYGTKKEPNAIICSTIQSAPLLSSLLPHFKAVFVDEVHKMVSKRAISIYNKLTSASVRVAMSATAFKFGGSDKKQMYDVKGWFGPEFAKITTKELQERNFLSIANCHFFKVAEPQLLYEVYIDAVTKGIAENNYFHDLVSTLTRRLTGRSLIIVERIEQGDRLYDRLPNAFWVKGEDNVDTRKHVIKSLQTGSGNLVAIATSGIFDAGINVFVHNLVNAAGGKAEHQIVQRMGRGLRPSCDKTMLNYYDFLFLINEYLESHSEKRIKILKKEGHKVEIFSAEAIATWAEKFLNF